MKLYELGLQMKSLFNATDKELQEWIDDQKEVPEFLSEAFDLECHEGCKYYSAKSYGGCREIDCFKSLYSNDLEELRTAILMAYNHGYWHDGKLNDWVRPEVMIAEMFA